MKKFIVRLSLLCVLISMSFNSVDAQHRSRPYHRQHYHGDGFLRALDAAEHIGRAAVFGSIIHQLDDYTGIRLGYNAASLRTDMNGVNNDYSSGVNLGVVFGWHLGHSPLIIEPGVLYSMKGGKLYDSYGKSDITMHSIEIPFVLKAQLPLSPDCYVNLQPFFGGFLSFGFSGTSKYDGEPYDLYDEDLFDNTDAGLRMGTGLAVGNTYFEFAYDLGLVNLPTYNYDHMGFNHRKDTMKSNTLSFSVGFNF